MGDVTGDATNDATGDATGDVTGDAVRSLIDTEKKVEAFHYSVLRGTLIEELVLD